MDAKQYDGGKGHARPVNLPFLIKEKETEREQPREMSVDQHTAVRSLANERQPVSAH